MNIWMPHDFCLGLQGADYVHPIQGMKMIEMDHVILNILDPRNQVADDPGVIRNGDPQGVFDSSHGAGGMNRCSDPSYTREEGPNLSGVAVFDDEFKAPPHGAG